MSQVLPMWADLACSGPILQCSGESKSPLKTGHGLVGPTWTRGSLDSLVPINSSIRNCLGDDFDYLVFLIYCQEHRSSFFMEFIRKHDGQVSIYTWFCLDLSCIAFYGHHWGSTKLFSTLHKKTVSLPQAVVFNHHNPWSYIVMVPSVSWYVVDEPIYVIPAICFIIGITVRLCLVAAHARFWYLYFIRFQF